MTEQKQQQQSLIQMAHEEPEIIYLQKRQMLRDELWSLEKTNPRRLELQNELRCGFYKYIAPLGPLVVSKLLKSEMGIRHNYG